MKKFILGILLGILIAGITVSFFKKQDGGGALQNSAPAALNKIRNNQIKPRTNLQEKFQQAAAELMNAKSPQDMLSALEDIIKIRPQDPNLYALKAQLLQKQGNLAGALEALNKAISIEPKNPNYYQLRAETEFALQNYQAAERDFTVAAQLSGKADNYYNRAITNLNLGNYQAANQDFKTAQKLYKQEGNLGASKQTQNITNVLSKVMPKAIPQTNLKQTTTAPKQQSNKEIDKEITSKISQSLKHFSQSETLSQFKDLLPNHGEGLPDFADIAAEQSTKAPKIKKQDLIKGTALESIQKAKKQIAQKDFDGAKQILDKAISEHPENDSLYYNRAQANYQQGNYQEAFNDLNKALELNPKNYQAASSKGDLYQAMGQTEQAKKAYQEAAQTAKEAGNKKGAEEAKAKYQLLEGKEITAKTNQRLAEAANAYYKKDYDTAANIFNQIYRENPNADNAFNLGLAYQGQGKTKEANQMFSVAAEQKPQDINTQMLAAQTAVQLQDFNSAAQYVERAKKIDSTNPDIWALSAQINSNNGDFDSTKRDLQNALNGYDKKLSETIEETERQRIESQVKEINNYLQQLEQAGK